MAASGRPRLAAAGSLACLAVIAAALAALDQLAQRVYADESALLAGFATPELAAQSTATARATCGADLFARLRELRLEPQRHTRLVDRNCSCESISAVVRAQRGDGKEALLLLVQLSDAGILNRENYCQAVSRPARHGEALQLGDADERTISLLLQLSDHLSRTSWLAKDVQLLFFSCCACDRPAYSTCNSAAVRGYLEDQTLLVARGSYFHARALAGARLHAATSAHRGEVPLFWPTMPPFSSVCSLLAEWTRWLDPYSYRNLDANGCCTDCSASRRHRI